MMTDTQHLKEKYESMVKLIRECKPGDLASENMYGIAYQNMVKAGMAMQIRKKYRGRNG